MDLDSLAREVVPGIRLLPVVHDRLDLAAVVRVTIERLEPQAIAVELPPTLESFVLQAIRRLPRISLLVSQEKNEDALVWAVTPGDPFVEALRWANERERPIFFIDPDLRYQERHFEPVPDPYALWSLGPEAYLRTVVEGVGHRAKTAADRAREAGMAFHIQRARKTLSQGTLLVLVGAAHFPGVSEKLAGPTAEPLARRRRQSVELRHVHPESLTALLPDPPLAHAAFELLRRGKPEAPPLEAVLSRQLSLSRHGLRLITREKPRDREERRSNLVHFSAAQASRDFEGSAVPDRLALGAVVWQIGSRSYTEQNRESVHAWQRRLFFDFGRRYARAQGLLVPGLYEWVVASRGVGDDNLAWEVFDAARTYPWQSEQAEIPLARVEGSELDLGTRKVRFRRRFFRVKQRWVPVPVRQRRETDDPDEWIRAFDARGICSYPPEDLVVEDYGQFLQQKALGLLSAERRRVEPFSTSLLDGIDIRETLLKHHEGRIYVQELGRAPGKAGSVVVIFDRDLGAESRYSYRMTWHGEHDQESDMAFYSTEPSEQVVGPGIMRATYGGFMMTMPPGRVVDVWSDPDYREAREKAEVLLMAAVDYSLEKIIVHVGKTAPADRLRQYAGRQGKRVVHIPLGSLSVAALKKIRVLHILAGHDKRALARNYIW